MPLLPPLRRALRLATLWQLAAAADGTKNVRTAPTPPAGSTEWVQGPSVTADPNVVPTVVPGTDELDPSEMTEIPSTVPPPDYGPTVSPLQPTRQQDVLNDDGSKSEERTWLQSLYERIFGDEDPSDKLLTEREVNSLWYLLRDGVTDRSGNAIDLFAGENFEFPEVPLALAAGPDSEHIAGTLTVEGDLAFIMAGINATAANCSAVTSTELPSVAAMPIEYTLTQIISESTASLDGPFMDFAKPDVGRARFIQAEGGVYAPVFFRDLAANTQQEVTYSPSLMYYPVESSITSTIYACELHGQSKTYNWNTTIHANGRFSVTVPSGTADVDAAEDTEVIRNIVNALSSIALTGLGDEEQMVLTSTALQKDVVLLSTVARKSVMRYAADKDSYAGSGGGSLEGASGDIILSVTEEPAGSYRLSVQVANSYIVSIKVDAEGLVTQKGNVISTRMEVATEQNAAEQTVTGLLQDLVSFTVGEDSVTLSSTTASLKFDRSYTVYTPVAGAVEAEEQREEEKQEETAGEVRRRLQQLDDEAAAVLGQELPLEELAADPTTTTSTITTVAPNAEILREVTVGGAVPNAEILREGTNTVAPNAEILRETNPTTVAPDAELLRDTTTVVPGVVTTVVPVATVVTTAVPVTTVVTTVVPVTTAVTTVVPVTTVTTAVTTAASTEASTTTTANNGHPLKGFQRRCPTNGTATKYYQAVESSYQGGNSTELLPGVKVPVTISMLYNESINSYEMALYAANYTTFTMTKNVHDISSIQVQENLYNFTAATTAEETIWRMLLNLRSFDIDDEFVSVKSQDDESLIFAVNSVYHMNVTSFYNVNGTNESLGTLTIPAIISRRNFGQDVSRDGADYNFLLYLVDQHQATFHVADQGATQLRGQVLSTGVRRWAPTGRINAARKVLDLLWNTSQWVVSEDGCEMTIVADGVGNVTLQHAANTESSLFTMPLLRPALPYASFTPVSVNETLANVEGRLHFHNDWVFLMESDAGLFPTTYVNRTSNNRVTIPQFLSEIELTNRLRAAYELDNQYYYGYLTSPLSFTGLSQRGFDGSDNSLAAQLFEGMTDSVNVSVLGITYNGTFTEATESLDGSSVFAGAVSLSGESAVSMAVGDMAVNVTISPPQDAENVIAVEQGLTGASASTDYERQVQTALLEASTLRRNDDGTYSMCSSDGSTCVELQVTVPIL